VYSKNTCPHQKPYQSQAFDLAAKHNRAGIIKADKVKNILANVDANGSQNR